MHGGDIYNNDIEMDFSVNINPYMIPDSLKQTILQSIDQLDRYPEYSYLRLKNKIASLHGVGPENVICGNGASEIFMAIIHAFNPKRALLVAPSFYGYEYCLNAVDTKLNYYLTCESEKFRLTEKFLDRLDDDLDIVILGNPNNPSGQIIPDNLLKQILDRCYEYDIKVVVDECFYALSEKKADDNTYDMIFDVDKYPNLIRVNAFTKLFAIPGVRIGYALCTADNNIKISKHLPEWNVSVLAQNVGCKCADIMLTTDYVNRSLEYTQKEKEKLIAKLSEIGIKVFDSATNFILVKSDMNLYAELLKRKILIRKCDEFNGLRDGFFRIAIKDRESNNRLIEEIEKIYGKL